MAVYEGPIAERIDWVFELARRHTEAYRSPEARLARDLYRARHPTAIAVLKCMDGRIDIPVVTQTPPGIIQPFRNLGGMFDLGWPHLGEVLAHSVQREVAEGRRVLILITYHFSRGDRKRGCAGFNYDTEAAFTFTLRIRQQAEAIFGARHVAVYPVICGFETDEDALILHGQSGEVLDLSTLAAEGGDAIDGRLESLFPDMHRQMRQDLARLLRGNLEWTCRMRGKARALDIQHREWMICLGRGFDFLHTPNLALIIGPYSPNLADPIARAAGIIEANMQEGRIPDDGFLLLASVPYEEIGPDRARAELKSRFLADFATEVIRERYPQLMARMHRRTAVLSWHSRALELLEDAWCPMPEAGDG